MVKPLIFALAAFGTLASFNAQCAQTTATSFTDKDQCASCQMWITRYPGPKGEIVLKNGSVQKFCSARGMACGVAVMSEEQRKDIVALWVHDAGQTDWKKPSDMHLIDASKAWYVYGSGMKAVMGPSLAPFADKQAAVEFQKKYGGELYRLEDLTKGVLGCKAKY